MARRRYPLPRGANLAAGFWGCSFCGGRGCLACQQQADRSYREQFPDGPKPILTINAEYHLEMATMQDDGCPNIDIPEVFPEPTGDDSLSRIVRSILASLPVGYPTKGVRLC